MTAPFVPPEGFSISLGFADPWDAALATAFYPEGMPPEWQANYLVLMTDAVVLNPTSAAFAEVWTACREAPKPVQGVWYGGDLPADAADLSVSLPLPLLTWVTGQEWTPGASVHGATIGLLAPGLSPRALRDALEAFARQAPAAPCALLFTGGAAAVPLLDQTRTLIELLGW